MDDLTAFITARLDEDEAAAQACADYDTLSCADLPGVHMTTARVLREVEAKRAVLNAYVCTDGDSPRDRDRGRWDGLHATVRHLAAVYSDHPDYRQEWKP